MESGLCFDLVELLSKPILLLLTVLPEVIEGLNHHFVVRNLCFKFDQFQIEFGVFVLGVFNR